MQNHSSTCVMWLLSQHHIASRLYQKPHALRAIKGTALGPLHFFSQLMCHTLWFFFAVCFFSNLKERGCDFTSAYRQSCTIINRSLSSTKTIVALFAAESTAACTIRRSASLSMWRVFTPCSCSLELSMSINLRLFSQLDRKCSFFILRGILPTKFTLGATKPLVQGRCAVSLVPGPALYLSNTTIGFVYFCWMYSTWPFAMELKVSSCFHGIRWRSDPSSMTWFISPAISGGCISFPLPQSICHLQAAPCLPPGEVCVDQKEEMVDCKAHIEKFLQHSLSCFRPLLSNAEIAVGDQFAAVHHLSPKCF